MTECVDTKLFESADPIPDTSTRPDSCADGKLIGVIDVIPDTSGTTDLCQDEKFLSPDPAPPIVTRVCCPPTQAVAIASHGRVMQTSGAGVASWGKVPSACPCGEEIEVSTWELVGQKLFESIDGVPDTSEEDMLCTSDKLLGEDDPIPDTSEGIGTCHDDKLIGTDDPIPDTWESLAECEDNKLLVTADAIPDTSGDLEDCDSDPMSFGS